MFQQELLSTRRLVYGDGDMVSYCKECKNHYRSGWNTDLYNREAEQ